MEEVVEETVELLVQQSLHFILEVGLSFFIMFTGVQTQNVGHEYLDGIEVLMEADLGQRDSNGPVVLSLGQILNFHKYLALPVS